MPGKDNISELLLWKRYCVTKDNNSVTDFENKDSHMCPKYIKGRINNVLSFLEVNANRLKFYSIHTDGDIKKDITDTYINIMSEINKLRVLNNK